MMRKLLSNKYYILVISVATFILLFALLIPGCTGNTSYLTDDSENSSENISSDSSEDEESNEERVKRIMESDTKNDDTVITAIPFSTDTFGEYTFIVEKSGTYKFNAVNITGADTEVYWNVFAFEEPYKFGSNYMMKNYEPEIVTDGNLTLYKGQYVYCICSLNQYNYNNTSVSAYLKIRFINEVNDNLHVPHSHDFKVKVDVSDCEKPGYIIYECSCGETYIEAVKPTGHEYEEVKTEPTCTSDGFTTYTCKKCNHTYTEPGEKALGHVCDNTNVHITADKHTFTCTTCGEKISNEHTFVNTAFITGMTDNNGTIKYYLINLRKVCDVCKYSDTLEVPDVEHIASSYKYDKKTETLTFECDDCGKCSYKCSISLDYEIIQEADETSSSDPAEE